MPLNKFLFGIQLEIFESDDHLGGHEEDIFKPLELVSMIITVDAGTEPEKIRGVKI